MGNKEAKLKEQFLFAIVANKEGDVANFLKKYPDYVNTNLVEETTNPICRAAYLGHQKLCSLLLKYGADINLRSSDGRTPLMWASFRNNDKMCEFLIDNGADITLEDNKGWNALDIAIIKMNYEAALMTRRKGLQPREKELYENQLWQKYDVELFLSYLQEDREQVDYKRFFDLIKKQQEEWNNRDLVVDPRESWKQFFKRQMNFDDPPLVPREELPEQNQPHRTFYGKLSCFLNNIDPYPPKPRDLGNPLDNTNNSVSANTPLNDLLRIKQQSQRQASNGGSNNINGIDMNQDQTLDQNSDMLTGGGIPNNNDLEEHKNQQQDYEQNQIQDQDSYYKNNDDQVYTFQEEFGVQPDPGTYAINSDAQQRISLLEDSKRQELNLQVNDIEDDI